MEAKKKFIVNATYYIIIALLVIAAYRYVLPILVPFIIGFCVAAILRTPVKKLNIRNNRLRRILLLICCIIFYVIVAALIILFGSKIVSELSAFIAYIPELFTDHLLPLMEQIMDEVKEMASSSESRLANYVSDLGEGFIQSAGEFITGFSTDALKLVAGGVIGIPGLIISIILTIVSTVYFAMDFEKVVEFAKKVIPEKRRDTTIEAFQYAKKAVTVYIKSYSLLFCITFTELAIGLTILQIPYSILLALGIAIFDLMPVLGTGGVLLPWSVTLFCLGNIPLGLGILGLYIFISIVRNTLEPKIVGKQIGLHPLATLIALILGLRLVGLIGMLAFPITLVAAMNIRRRKQEQQAQEQQTQEQQTQEQQTQEQQNETEKARG